MQAVSIRALGILKRIEILIMDHPSWQKKGIKKKVISFLKRTIIFKFFSLPTKKLPKGLFQDQTKRGKLSAFYMNATGNSWSSGKYSCILPIVSCACVNSTIFSEAFSPFKKVTFALPISRSRTIYSVSKFFLGKTMFF